MSSAVCSIDGARDNTLAVIGGAETTITRDAPQQSMRHPAKPKPKPKPEPPAVTEYGTQAG
ncbi:hypothetical protein [Paraburkholderia dilworthii]|uniref:hypothetical protein n=1 Tax=Paraburkholderia dilworthii TaxID=948106 RepID=UPI0004047461|nr:hypothetical protein [Paraburkholderia dilworthii]